MTAPRINRLVFWMPVADPVISGNRVRHDGMQKAHISNYDTAFVHVVLDPRNQIFRAGLPIQQEMHHNLNCKCWRDNKLL